MQKSCLILHAGALGDCVLTLHVAMAVRGTGFNVTVAARSTITSWAMRRGAIDQAISLDRLGPLLWNTQPNSITEKLSDPANLQQYDLVISFLGGPDEPVAKRLDALCGENKVIHIDPRPNEETRGYGSHMVMQWLGEIERRRPDLPCKEVDLPYEVIRAKSPTDQYSPGIIVHPGSGGQPKRCPLNALEDLMLKLKERGSRVQWMIGPDEMERDGPKLVEQLKRTAQVYFEESLERAADFVSCAEAYVGNDAGMTHVAALAGVNTVVLYRPTGPNAWAPLGLTTYHSDFPSREIPLSVWSESVVTLLDLASQSRNQCHPKQT